MIKYTLKCSADHRFESWFASAEAYDSLRSAGRVTCAVCGVPDVEKAMMAPQVQPGRRKAAVPAPQPTPPSASETAPAPAAAGALGAPGSELEAKIAEVRRLVEANSDYVGPSFAKEARAIHDGDAPGRAIYGEASGAEVKDLLDDGVAIAPLPFTPQRKVN